MTNTPSGKVQEWLTRSGWSPERNIESEVGDLLRERVTEFEANNIPLSALGKARKFLINYGLLELQSPFTTNTLVEFDPRYGNPRDIEEMGELATNLKAGVFPVGYEEGELGVIVIDEHERFFYLHHTGQYLLGETSAEAMANLMRPGPLQDAEDFYV